MRKNKKTTEVKEHPCLVFTTRGFFWWKRTEKYFNHQWAYDINDLDQKTRTCLQCGQQEILWRITTENFGIFEDWRPHN